MRPDANREPGMLGYILCSEPRSGSNFLAAVLASTGLLGRPAEYFSSAANRRLARRAELEPVLSQAATPNGVYGIKLFSYQFDLIAGTGWIDRLPDPRFVHLERRDLLGQAISNLRLIQTGRRHSGVPDRGEPRYDGPALAAQLRRLAADQARWRVYFARNAIDPLWLDYEEVTADPQAAAEAVAAHLGVAEPPLVDLADIRLGVQRDAVSSEWRERFLAEARDLDRLDEWALGGRRPALRRLRERLGLSELRDRRR